MNQPPVSPDESPKLLITGASGFLGYNLCCQALLQGFDVYSFVNKHPVHDARVKSFNVDITNRSAVLFALATINPRYVIHAAAVADPNVAQRNPQASFAINVCGSESVAQACKSVNAKCVFVSTDLVFNGAHAPYKESDPVAPVSAYGEQKVFAERSMQKVLENVTICRMPLMFGYGGEFGNSFLTGMIKALQTNTPLKLFVDEYRTPLCGVSAAQGILQALLWNLPCVHLGGSTRISRYDIGVMLKEIAKVDCEIIPVKQSDVIMAAPRPPDVSLNISLAQQNGFSPRNIRESIVNEYEKIIAAM